MEGIPEADIKEHEQQRNKPGGNKKNERDSDSSDDETTVKKAKVEDASPPVVTQPVMTMPQGLQMMTLPNVRINKPNEGNLVIVLSTHNFNAIVMCSGVSSGTNGCRSCSTEDVGYASNVAGDDAWICSRNAPQLIST